jgi:ribosome-associated protein
LTEAQKQRVLSKLGPRVVAIAQDARSQSQNRELALDRLRRRLESALQVDPPRRPTRPSRASERERLESKRSQAQRKRQRRSPDVSDE